MTEVRDNIVTGKRVIVAPVRGHRPMPPATPDRAASPSDCPFCPGNEAALPGLAFELPGDNAAGWLTRAVPNKYPVVSGDGGRHEIIIESPDHTARLATYPATQLRAILDTYQRRLTTAWEYPAILSVQLFRNEGRAAGASIEHAHSQLVALPFVPSDQTRREDSWRHHLARHGQTPLQEMVAAERAAGKRVIADEAGFVTFVPWAAETSFEQWIAPRGTGAGFEDLSDEQLAALAGHVGRAAKRQAGVLGGVPYNMLLLAPSRALRDEMAGEWCFRLMPRTARAAGLELNTGLAVNGSAPEADAAALRGWTV